MKNANNHTIRERDKISRKNSLLGLKNNGHYTILLDNLGTRDNFMAANTRQGGNGKGRDITDADLIAEAATCGVPESKVRTMIAEVNVALKQHRLRQKNS